MFVQQIAKTIKRFVMDAGIAGCRNKDDTNCKVGRSVIILRFSAIVCLWL